MVSYILIKGQTRPGRGRIGRGVFCMRRRVKIIKLCSTGCHLHVLARDRRSRVSRKPRTLRLIATYSSTRRWGALPVSDRGIPLVLDHCGSTDCPFWQAWDLSQKVIEGVKGGSGKNAGSRGERCGCCGILIGPDEGLFCGRMRDAFVDKENLKCGTHSSTKENLKRGTGLL